MRNFFVYELQVFSKHFSLYFRNTSLKPQSGAYKIRSAPTIYLLYDKCRGIIGVVQRRLSAVDKITII